MNKYIYLVPAVALLVGCASLGHHDKTSDANAGQTIPRTKVASLADEHGFKDYYPVPMQQINKQQNPTILPPNLRVVS